MYIFYLVCIWSDEAVVHVLYISILCRFKWVQVWINSIRFQISNWNHDSNMQKCSLWQTSRNPSWEHSFVFEQHSLCALNLESIPNGILIPVWSCTRLQFFLHHPSLVYMEALVIMYMYMYMYAVYNVHAQLYTCTLNWKHCWLQTSAQLHTTVYILHQLTTVICVLDTEQAN